MPPPGVCGGGFFRILCFGSQLSRNMAMNIEWTYTAGTLYDQLSHPEKSMVLHAVERLPYEWEQLKGDRLQKLTGDLDGYYSLRIGFEFFAILSRDKDAIQVVDLIRKGQVDGLRRLRAASQAVSR